MPHFLVKKEEIKKDFIELFDKDNFFHITKVLRAKIGEKIKFIDENKNVYLSCIEKIEKKSLKAKIIKKYQSNRFLDINLSLIQSILADNNSQNLLIANATQTGVQKIYPVISDNVAISKKNLFEKEEKWQKIAHENFKQCERADILTIEKISTLKDILKQFKKENIIIFAEKYENISLENCLIDVDKKSEIAVIVGPEGGFSENEFNYFKENNFKLISLGSMIYKAPNAVVAGISNIISRLK